MSSSAAFVKLIEPMRTLSPSITTGLDSILSVP